MRADLLFEIGTEEIPAGFLARALAELPALAKARLEAARLEHAEIVAVGTPRRLALAVRGLADRQADVSEQVIGPPATAAFDKEGKPTKAGEGFAAKTGVPVAELKIVEVPGKKGQYVAAQREQRGAETRSLLPALLVELARAIPWKKSMRWASFDETFVRPVHWIVALYGGEVVPLSAYGVQSGGATRGHRFLAPGELVLDGTLDDYRGKLRQAFVIVEPEARRTAIEAELAATGLRVRPDADLLAEVANLVEYPKAVAGTFNEAFLAIPPEVIISAMRGHQRYFAAERPDGGLDNRFITIAGTLTRDLDVVREGNERVLAARLSDARFFYEEDRETSVETLRARLGGVTFQKALGSVADKVERIRQLAISFAPVTDVEPLQAAASLCKLDLVTKMVGEFPDLQGVMGRYYAPGWNATPEVAEAILEHYLPRGATDKLPAGALGAALGVADRLDTIVGCWAVGLAPTGSNDAYGLRRAALAVLNILIARDWTQSLRLLLKDAKQPVAVSEPQLAEILEFFKTRLRGLLVSGDGGRGLPGDCVDAALAPGIDNVPEAVRRAVAVAHLRDRPDFEPLGVAFKRVANILNGASANAIPSMPDDAHDSEKKLHAENLRVRGEVDRHAGDFDAVLRDLASLKPAIDQFFTDVMVMDKDLDVRERRLNLLKAINWSFMRVADFSKLAVK